MLCILRRLQVICEKADRTDIPTIDKKKYLVPSVRSTDIIDIVDCLTLIPHSGSDSRTICLRYPQTD